MNIQYSIIFILLWSFTSCNFFGPTDINIQRKNVDIESNDIIGTWTMDKFSYKYLSEFKNNSVVLNFKSDKIFKMNNSQNLFKGEIDSEISSGTWEVIEQNDKKKIKLIFDKTKTTMDLEIYQLKHDYQLWHFLSDPDNGERIRFLK